MELLVWHFWTFNSLKLYLNINITYNLVIEDEDCIEIFLVDIIGGMQSNEYLI